MTRLLLLALLFSPTAAATVITLGTSTQNVTYTGVGITQGAGTSRVTLGACTSDGTNTTCTLSGQYTGLGSGGTYQIQIVYPGSTSTLLAQTNPPSSNAPVLSLTAGTVSLVTTITPTGGSPVHFYYTYISLQFPNPTCTGTSTCNLSSIGQTPGATITGQVTGQLDLTPRVSSVISASSYGGFNAIAPGTWIEIYGENLATVVQQTWAGSDFNGANAPTSLGGTTVTINGQPAYVDFVGESQVNVQVPSNIPAGTQNLVVTTFGGASSGTLVKVNPVEPGLLAPAVFQLSAGQYVAALFSNGSTFALPPGVTNAVPTQRAKPGDIITMYGIGFGNVTPNINAGVVVSQANSLSGVQFSIGGQPATVQYAGLVSGFLGLYQFNVVVPNVPANDATPITFTLNGSPALQPQLLLPVGN